MAAVAVAFALVACTRPTAESAPSDNGVGSSTPVVPSAEATATATAEATATPPAEATATPPAGDVTTVTIRDVSFGTPEITVAVGVVTFVNEDEVEHTATEGDNGAAAPDGRFDVFIGIGESVEVSFAEAGDYRITCQFHPEMHLIVHAH
jgi:plastocyanin